MCIKVAALVFHKPDNVLYLMRWVPGHGSLCFKKLVSYYCSTKRLLLKNDVCVGAHALLTWFLPWQGPNDRPAARLSLP